MLYLFIGTDTERVRAKMETLLGKVKAPTFRITDAHSLADLEAALFGGGMFGEMRTVVLDGALANEEMNPVLLAKLESLRDADDIYCIVEKQLDVATKKKIEKYAEGSERFDMVKAKEKETIFALANALQRGTKKDLWVGYQRELAQGKAPEAIHGVLFWAAKQQLLRNGKDVRARDLVAKLAELPHEARRQGFDMEYALELFALSRA